MSGVLGIIAEYNPFHNGHLYQLSESKKLSGCHSTICIMSGNFTQRGEPAIIDKWTRAKMAVANGADLVLELPLLYSISSAENFCEGAIRLLDALKIVDTFSFGSELADISVLNEFATVLCDEPKEYISILNHELSKGVSYPKARENALLMYLNDIRKYANVLSSPNNILGIEYLKALKKCQSSMTPLTIQRMGPAHDTDGITSSMASASYIRKMIVKNKLSEIKKVMPDSSFALLSESVKYGNIVPDLSKFENQIVYILRKMSVQEIAQLPDVTEGLENLIKEAANTCNSVPELIRHIKSKRYTETRIKRILLYALLSITKKDMAISKKHLPYARVLAFNRNGQKLLSSICEANAKMPVITSVKKFMDAAPNKTLMNVLEKEIFATNVYTIGYEYESLANLDYTKKLEVQ